MKKVGKIVTTEQQLCYAHGVQLAILDVLYKSRTFKATVAVDEERCHKKTPHRPHRRQIQVLGIGNMCLVRCILLISIKKSNR